MKLIKIIAMMIVVLVMVGCAAGWVLTYRALGDTESKLHEANAGTAGLQQELQDARDDLTGAQDDLQDATQSLSEARQQLEEQIVETEKYLDMYRDSQAELDDTETELAAANHDLLEAETRNSDLEEELAEIREKLDLYEDTMGITVYSGADPPYTSGNSGELHLTNNTAAGDPTWQELLDFLREDKTDKILYVTGEFECGNFAQQLHDNAESAGIRAAFVAIHYYEGPPHAVNAFKTVDKGLVYIDDTGSPTSLGLINLDKKVKMSKDAAYITTLLFPQAGWFIPESDDIVESIEIYW